MNSADPAKSEPVPNYTPPAPSGGVLPTLNKDGTRRWIRPRNYPGRYRKLRGFVAWALIGLFFLLPFLKVAGKPVVLLDVPRREFVLFGTTFLPTDGVLLMLLALSAFVAIFFVTALLGRVWCGWACPQTVYMEFVFRPIEQWLEGTRGQQLKLDREGPNARRVLKFAVYAVLSLVVGNLFLSYFVGVERLSVWATQSPFEHPSSFLVVAVTAGLVFFDFAYFREQMCTVICPYARLQSVLLDDRSLIVAYDEKRGEPRGHGKNAGGDCIDCKACVIACPTGIDIRQGLQLECVACTGCIDACDSVMSKLKKPPGLIKFTNQNWLETGQLGPMARPRVLIYPVILTALLGGLWFFGTAHSRPEITVLRGIGAPFSVQGDRIQNQLRIKLRNRSDAPALYQLSIDDLGEGELVAPENPVFVGSGEQVTTSVFVLLPQDSFQSGVRAMTLRVTTEDGETTLIDYKLLGPSR